MSELVTGDAVVLGLRPAKLPSRALSIFIDLVLIWGGYLLVSLALLSATGSLDDAAFAAVQVALLMLLLIGVPVAIETLSNGRSLGKLICGLRVVREDGGPIRFRYALVRGAMGLVEIQLSFGVIACIASLVSARGRRLGDVFAGTLVVRERLPASKAGWVEPPPPQLAGQLSGLDLSRVPEGLWLAIRQYLQRARQLDPQVSHSMAQRLAADAAAWTGSRPPEGVPAEGYLAGMVAERQRRDARHLHGTPQPPAPGAAAPGGAPVPAAPGGPPAPSPFAPPAEAPPTTPPTPAAPTGWAPAPEAAASGQARESAESGEAAGTAQAEQSRPPTAPRDEPPATGTTATGFVPPA